MTKEEFMKKAMGAQYSERESGILDMVGKKNAKENLGAQFSEREYNRMMGIESKGLMDLTEKENAYVRMMKENLGAQFSEKEAMAMVKSGEGDMKKALGAQYTERETDAFGLPIPEVDYTALRQKFSSILGSISPKEQEKVIQHWQRADEDGKIKFMQYIVENPDRAIGYGVQDETIVPTVTNTSNLGFGDVAQGSEYYNDNFGIFMPSSYESGYTGATGDERFKQGTDGYGFDSYPHGANRNYYNEQMFRNKFMPLKLG